MIKILIADDYAVVREGLIPILLEGFPEAIFGEASNALKTLQIVRQQNWSLLTLDIGTPGRSGVNTLRDVRAYDPRCLY